MNTKDALTAAERMLSVSEQLERFFARVLDNEEIPGRDDLNDAMDAANHAEQLDPELLRESMECARPLNPVNQFTGD